MLIRCLLIVFKKTQSQAGGGAACTPLIPALGREGGKEERKRKRRKLNLASLGSLKYVSTDGAEFF